MASSLRYELTCRKVKSEAVNCKTEMRLSVRKKKKEKQKTRSKRDGGFESAQ